MLPAREDEVMILRNSWILPVVVGLFFFKGLAWAGSWSDEPPLEAGLKCYRALDFAGAAGHLEKALRQPSDMEGRQELVHSLLQLKRYRDAAKHLTLLRQKFPEQEDLKVLEKSLLQIIFMDDKASALPSGTPTLLRNDHPKSEEPKGKAKQDPALAASLFQKAMASQKEGKIEAAIVEYIEASEHDPALQSQDDQGLIQAAQAFFRKKETGGPLGEDDLYRYARFLFWDGHVPDARAKIKKLTEAFPESKYLSGEFSLVESLLTMDHSDPLPIIATSSLLPGKTKDERIQEIKDRLKEIADRYESMLIETENYNYLEKKDSKAFHGKDGRSKTVEELEEEKAALRVELAGLKAEESGLRAELSNLQSQILSPPR